MSIKPKRIALSMLAFLFMLGVILALGFLSFTGMLSVYSSIILAITAFILSGIIEGEVLRQNILQAFKKLSFKSLFADISLEHKICQKKLQEFLKKEHNSQISKDYKAINAAIHSLEAQAYLDDAAKEILEYEKMRKKAIEQYFTAYVMNKHDNFLNHKLDEKELEAIRAEIATKSSLSRFCFLASLFAGVGYGFVFLNAAPSSTTALLSYFGIELMAASFPLWLTVSIYAFAIISVLGFMLLIYNNLTNMVAEDSFHKWSKQLREFFKVPDGEITFVFLLKKIGIALLVTFVGFLTIFASVAMTGTWWNEAQAGILTILPTLKDAAEQTVYVICGATVVTMGATTLCYNSFNSVKAAKQLLRALGSKLWDAISNKLKELKQEVKIYFDQENIIQFFNPFRAMILLISAPFKILVFLGHIISSGLAGEGADILPESWAGTTTAGIALQDAIVDGVFVFHENHSHAPKEAYEHTHKEEAQSLLQEEESVPKHSHAGKHAHEESEPHDHDHSAGIPEMVRIALLSPIYALSIFWDWLFSQLNRLKPAVTEHAESLTSENDFVPLDDDSMQNIESKEKPLSLSESFTKTWYGIQALDSQPVFKPVSIDQTIWETISDFKMEEDVKKEKLSPKDKLTLRQLRGTKTQEEDTLSELESEKGAKWHKAIMLCKR